MQSMSANSQAIAKSARRRHALLPGHRLLPLLATAVRISTGYYFALPERYGLSLFPLFLIAAALLVRQSERRAPVAVLAGLGVLSYAAMLTIPS